jgi:hypothetical protein
MAGGWFVMEKIGKRRFLIKNSGGCPGVPFANK